MKLFVNLFQLFLFNYGTTITPEGINVFIILFIITFISLKQSLFTFLLDKPVNNVYMEPYFSTNFQTDNILSVFVRKKYYLLH